MKGPDVSQGTVIVEAPMGRPTLRVAYFFSGVKRKASIGSCLKAMCIDAKVGLSMHEIDILVGGSEHDLMDKESQEAWLDRVRGGEFDIIIFSPPCGTWSRANWANDAGPQPCRNRKHPWGLPGQLASQRKRAEAGNEFVHFTIRGIEAAQASKGQGRDVACLLEHPEDLGMTHRGEPASIWQLAEIRKVFGNSKFTTVAGHQCQYPDTDRKKPTRLLSDIDGIEEFGYVGWPKFDAGGWYVGPLPHDCGHNHRQRMIGRNKKGGFHTAPTAAYPPGMCEFLAKKIFQHWFKRINQRSPFGRGVSSTSPRSSMTSTISSTRAPTSTSSLPPTSKRPSSAPPTSSR